MQRRSVVDSNEREWEILVGNVGPGVGVMRSKEDEERPHPLRFIDRVTPLADALANFPSYLSFFTSFLSSLTHFLSTIHRAHHAHHALCFLRIHTKKHRCSICIMISKLRRNNYHNVPDNGINKFTDKRILKNSVFSKIDYICKIKSKFRII